MKQRLGIHLAVALLAAVTACGSDSESTTDTAPDIEAATDATSDTETSTEGDAVEMEGEPEAGAFPLTVEDCERTVTLDAPPERILTVGSVAVNMLHAAGASDLVVARSGEFGTPAAGAAGESVADADVLVDDDPATEAILGTEVDFVYGYGLFNTSADDLAAADIESLVTAGYCGSDGGGTAEDGDLIDVVLAEVDRLGTIFGTTDEATAAIDDLSARLDAVDQSDLGTVATLYWFGDDPSAYGGGAMMQAMFDRLGAKNVFGDSPEAFLPLDVEALLDADPDTIVVMWGLDGESDDALAREKLFALPGGADLSAVRSGRVVSLASIYAEPDVAAVDGVEILSEEFALLPDA